ncbi:MAG: RIO1 family regulatory kinase/ATPase [Planctomycetota bacterium]
MGKDPGPVVPKFPRADLEARSVRVLRPKTWVAPDVRLLDMDGRPAVLKDFAPLPMATRLTIGLPLIRWEVPILRRLIGLEGVPQLLYTVDRFAFVMSYIEARPLYKLPTAELPAGIFDRVLDLVDAIHARGVVHLDLRQRKNTLITSANRPAIIDFASAMHFGKDGKIFRFMKNVDRTAILKLKNRVLPGSLTEEEKEQLHAFDRMRRFWPLKRRRPNLKDRIS